MDHTPFLKQVAEVFAENEKDTLSKICFVFPNKRSSVFFNDYLKNITGIDFMDKEHESNIETISSLINRISHRALADRQEQLFILYDEYSKLNAHKDPIDFDRFIFWGDMLISDFNDVDRYLVDPDALFVNIKRFKEISSTYLTEEQLEIIKKYWGEEPGYGYSSRFWNHLEKESDKKKSEKSKEKFLKLWDVMGKLYHSFHARLENNGKIAAGMQYRWLATHLRDFIAEGRPLHGSRVFTKYVFIGFNVLSPAEIKIFKTFKDTGLGDFYWDYNSPAFGTGFNRAGKFIEKNTKEFPSEYELPEEKITELPDIEIIGVPSGMAQVKLAGTILREWADDEKIIPDTSNARNTALVLPDESLFLGLRRSLPFDRIPKVNVTMGLPLKLTPIAALMKTIVSLQLRVRRTEGVLTFYYEDIIAVIGSSYIRNLAPGECDALENHILKNRLFRMSGEEIIAVAPSLSEVFVPLDSLRESLSVFLYITNLITLISARCTREDKKFLEGYLKAVNDIRKYAVDYNTEMLPASFFRLVEKIASKEKLHMKGEPLEGLQIMGVLETRAIDFDNVIMLSMNERIFPRKHSSGSFIPDALRKGYHMATTDFQECIYAYYFYRLIARAKNVKLIYDARSVGTKNGEMSRYLTQLIYLFGNTGKVKTSLRVFNPLESSSEEIVVKKTPEVLAKLEKFKTGGSEDKKYISASALSTYVSCPLSFYLKYVEGYNEDKEMLDYMDSGTYGTVVHNVLEEIYKTISERCDNLVPKNEIERYINDPEVLVEPLIVRQVNKEYKKLQSHRLNSPLEGETLIMGRMMREQVLAVLKADLEYAPLELITAEVSKPIDLKVSDELSVNFKLKIDRIDRSGGKLRVIDYKTGSDENNINDWNHFFSHENHRYTKKAVGQVMLYAYTYNILKNQDEPMALYIYNLKNIFTEGPQQVVINKEPVDDHRKFLPDFVEQLNETISEIFDPTVDFFQTEKERDCTFCQFKSMCRREEG